MKGPYLVRTVPVFVLLAVLASALPGQVPVKKNLMPLFDQVPPPPASVKEAYAKTTSIKETGGLRCNADKVFQSIDKETNSVEAAFKAQGRDGAIAAAGMTPEMVKKSQDPELKKQMKKMTKEEKMKMAMEMMNSGAIPQPTVVMDPPPIRAALDEWMKIYNGLPAEQQASGAAMQENIRIQQEYEKGHSDISDWERAEIEKLPQISSGEMSAPDPAQVKAVKLKASDRHIVHANRRLEAIRSEWTALAEKTRSKYGVFYQKFVTADYALESRNPSTKKTLADAQIMVLTDLGRLISQSRAAYQESARWMAERVEIEQQ